MNNAYLQTMAEHELRFTNSYSRAMCIARLFEVDHPRKIELLGENWSTCDWYPEEMHAVLDALPCPSVDAMTKEEWRYLVALPARITVWRGCFEHNRSGFSWTAIRGVAERFPTLNRYRHEDKEPILLQGMVNTDDILFVKFDRKESEIVPRPGAVMIIEELEIPQRKPRPHRYSGSVA